MISGIWSILDVFKLKNEENYKVMEKSGITPDGVRLWKLTPSLEVKDDGNYQRDAIETF